MKKKKALAQAALQRCEQILEGHDHIHAANCGHKSYVHAGHVCYEHDGHFHYMHNGHSHSCPGPFAKTQPVAMTNTVKPNQRPATVHNLDSARAKKKA